MTTKKVSSSKQHRPNPIDVYLKAIPEDKREVMLDMRATIRAVAPDADETFIYGVPGFKLNGKSLVCFAVFKKHCGFYPLNPEIINRFARELSGYQTAKGTIRFFTDQPLPKSLIRKIVLARVKEIKDSHQ